MKLKETESYYRLAGMKGGEIFPLITKYDTLERAREALKKHRLHSTLTEHKMWNDIALIREDVTVTRSFITRQSTQKKRGKANGPQKTDRFLP